MRGGAPLVLACAYAIPHRVVNLAIVSGTSPYNYRGTLKGMWLPVRAANELMVNEGHFSLIRKHLVSILRSLIYGTFSGKSEVVVIRHFS